MSEPKCIAHRGGPLIHNEPLPENSLAAVNRALNIGVDAVEIDIYRVEEELLVTHDRRLGRVISGTGLIADRPLSYLREQHLENGEAIPTLIDMLNLVSDRALLNIEVKGPGCMALLKKTLVEYCHDHQRSFEQYFISSFDHQQLFQSMQLLPAVRRGVLIEGIPRDYAQCCDALNAFSFNAHIGFLSAAMLDDARTRGLRNWVYTANHVDDWTSLRKMGVDAIFTDRPDELMAFYLSNGA